MADPVISIGAVLGILLSVILTHRLAAYREKQKELRSAVAEFKDSLSGTLTDLTHPDANPNLLITQNYSKHNEAAIKLSQKLPPKMVVRFNAAWEHYHILHEKKKSLGMLGMFASEVEDMSKGHDPMHIREVNAKRCREAISIIRNVVNSVGL